MTSPYARDRYSDVAGGHKHLYDVRGKATTCVFGHTNAKRYEWANLTGQYQEPDDYASMCTSCHHRYDNAIRKTTQDFNKYAWGSKDVSVNDRSEVRPMIKYRKISLQDSVVTRLQEISEVESKREERRVTLTEIVRKALKAYGKQANTLETGEH